MAGQLTLTTISDGTNSTSSTNCIQGSAKAWVNFNSSGGSSAVIRASYNVSSVTYNSTGNYTVNFTNAFADTNYSVVCAGRTQPGVTNAGCVVCVRTTDSSTGGITTTSCGILSIGISNSGAEANSPYVSASFFR